MVSKEEIEPPWLKIAQNEAGVSELSGTSHNPRILDYHRETSLKATDDETPWCSAFVSACLEWSGIPSTRSARAKSYLEWGYELKSPRIGAVAVLNRGTTEGPSGHVGFYMGETSTHIRLLGGNQKNMVCVLGYPKDRVVSYRWPYDPEIPDTLS